MLAHSRHSKVELSVVQTPEAQFCAQNSTLYFAHCDGYQMSKVLCSYIPTLSNLDTVSNTDSLSVLPAPEPVLVMSPLTQVSSELVMLGYHQCCSSMTSLSRPSSALSSPSSPWHSAVACSAGSGMRRTPSGPSPRPR